MAGHSLNNQAPGPGAPITAYLDSLSARLLGPRRRRTQILAELRDGLNHATDANLAAGMPTTQAQAHAVAHFGSAQAVADAFAGELGTAYARRTVAAYVLTGPLVGIWWLLLMRAGPWHAGLITLFAAIPVLPLIVLAIGTAAAILASTGRLMRWLPEATPERALTATILVAGLCFAGDLTMIGLFLASTNPFGPLAVVATSASVLRTGCSVAVARMAALMRRRWQTSG